MAVCGSYKLPTPAAAGTSGSCSTSALPPDRLLMSIPVPDRAPFAETPVPSSPDERCYGSDAIALMLRALDIPYVALNPGASFRGLHDSLVNRLGNERPQMLLCLHEE